MKKFLLIVSAITISALIAGGAYVYLEKQEAARLQAEATALAMQQLIKETDALSVNITYPIILGTTSEIVRANATIREDIQKKVQSFERDAKESASLGIDLPQEIKSTVTGSPSIEEKNERYVALFMGMEWYLRGAAHPSHSIDTYVFDYKRDKLVGQDFFRGEYLVLLSTLAREDLRNQAVHGDIGFDIDGPLLEEGTEPRIENFRHMLPLSDGLAIYFEEYQVAPYAAGPQQVVIPYEKLEEIINPEGVLGIYLK
jgi:hypothetical protein